jgi:hypothetical protein
MGYHQAYSLTTLNEEIKEFLKKIENEGVMIDRFHFSNEVIHTDLYEPLNAGGSSTDLGIVLNSIKEEEKDNLAGVILFTDGQITHGLDPVQTSSEIHVPIHIIGVGENTPLVDVAIKSIDVPTVAIKGEDVEATVVVVATGIIANGAIRAVCEVVGIKDIVAKSLGSSNSHNVVRACMKGLLNQLSPKNIFSLRGKKKYEITENKI